MQPAYEKCQPVVIRPDESAGDEADDDDDGDEKDDSGAEPGTDRDEREVVDAAGDSSPPLADRREVDVVLERDRMRAALLGLAAERAAKEPTSLTPPYDARSVFAAARRGDAVARAVVEEEARRIALHIAPVAAVADVGLVVLGGGIGANADLLLQPVRGLLAEWLPYPPRVEVSSLGEAAVLSGAVALGRRAALDNVFVNARARRADGGRKARLH